MASNRRTAIVVGLCYIAATVAGILSVIFAEPILNAPDYLIDVSANATQVTAGALFELIMGVAVAGIAIAVYPVLRKHNVSIAIGYFGARIVEGVIYIIGVVSLLTLLTLSQEFVKAGAPTASHFQTSAELLLAARDWGAHAILDVAVFPLGALIFSYLLFQARLVPRWLSGWGLIGAILYWAAGVLVMFALINPLSTAQQYLNFPLFVQEMVLAIWLIVKGFNPSAISSQSPRTDTNETQ